MNQMLDKNQLFCFSLRGIRIKKGLSQEKFAAEAGINEKYYGRVERGESSPTIRILFKICDKHHILLSELLYPLNK